MKVKPLPYPAMFLDDNWKKKEKEKDFHCSDTGIGKTLRDLKKATDALNAGVAGDFTTDEQILKVKPLILAFRTAGAAALAAIQKTSQHVNKKAQTDKAKYKKTLDHLSEMNFSMRNFSQNLDWDDQFLPSKNRNKWDDTFERAFDRATMRVKLT